MAFVTDPTALAIITWLGLIITFFGFWIAIYQILAAKTAAQTAASAVEKLEQNIFSRERLLELTTAAAHLASAKEHMAQRNFPAAIILIDVALPQFSQVEALLAVTERNKIHRTIIKLKKLTETLSTNDPQQIEGRAIPTVLETRNIITEINEICAVLRYQYPKEGSST